MSEPDNKATKFKCLQSALKQCLNSEKTLDLVAVKFADSNGENSCLTFGQLKAT